MKTLRLLLSVVLVYALAIGICCAAETERCGNAILTNSYQRLLYYIFRPYAVEDNPDSRQNVARQDAPPTVGLVSGNSDSRLKCISRNIHLYYTKEERSFLPRNIPNIVL